MSAVTQPTTFQDHLKTLGEILENLKKIGVQNADQKGQKCKVCFLCLCFIKFIKIYFFIFLNKN